MKRKGSREKPCLVVGVTAGLSTWALRGQLAYASREGFQVYLLASPDAQAIQFAQEEGVGLIPIPMKRELSPAADLIALVRIYRSLAALRPDIVNAGTPKAGFLVMIAAWLVGIPCRIFTMRGQRSLTLRGVKRHIVRFTERASCRLATRVFINSEGMLSRTVEEGFVSSQKAVVLAHGSSNGIDIERFSPTPEKQVMAVELRRNLGIPPGAPVVGFVGRLVVDKGIIELADAWQLLSQDMTDLHLLLVGPTESGDPLDSHTWELLSESDRAHLLGHVDDPSPAYLAMDVVALPSYREGFANVLLEAGAMATPAVASAIAGCREVIVDGETGALVPIGDVEALASALARYLADASLAKRHGMAGRKRAADLFRREDIWAAQIEEYRSCSQSDS